MAILIADNTMAVYNVPIPDVDNTVIIYNMTFYLEILHYIPVYIVAIY